MNPLNIFNRKNIEDILYKISIRIPFFLKEEVPHKINKVEYPYHWYQILDTTEINDPNIAESVLLDTIEYNPSNDYAVDTGDGKMSLDNFKNSEEELEDANDVFVEIL